MSEKRILTVDDVTGDIVEQWIGTDDQVLPPAQPGPKGNPRTRIDITSMPSMVNAQYKKKRWNGTAFVNRPTDLPATNTDRHVLDRIATKVGA